jgi:hypothetical protein
MRRRIAVFALAVGAGLMGAVTPAVADDAVLTATLTGKAEAPGPGDPDASGTASIFIDDDTNQLCLFLEWSDVDGTLSGLHIHFAPPGSPGPVVVPFATPPTPSSSTFQCVAVANEALLDNIAANPGQYYINLHSTPLFPGGAIRGQLRNPFASSK